MPNLHSAKTDKQNQLCVLNIGTVGINGLISLLQFWFRFRGVRIPRDERAAEQNRSKEADSVGRSLNGSKRHLVFTGQSAFTSHLAAG